MASGMMLLSVGCPLAMLSGLDDLACGHLLFRLRWLRCIPLQLVLATVTFTKSMAIELHESVCFWG